MKVYPDKLKDSLKQAIRPLYIVSGDEPLLLQESCDLIRETLRQQGYSERTRYHVDARFDWQQLLFSTNSMSLFANQKLIELRMPTGKPGDKGGKALQAYCQSLSEDTVLLMVLPKLDKAAQHTKWFKAVEAAGVLVQIWPMETANLPQWIHARFAKVGLTASNDAVAALAERIEGNLLAAVQEIERLRLIAKDDHITLTQVIDGVIDSSRFDIFALIDAAVGQNPARSIRIIRALKAENTELMYILALLSREVRSLISMSSGLSQGQGIDAVFKAARVWGKRKALVRRCLQRKKLAVLLRCLHTLAKIDNQVKGLAPGDAWLELERVTLRLSL